MPDDKPQTTVYIVLGIADADDNHTDEWVAGVYLDSDSAINAAKQNLQEDLVAQTESDAWWIRYHAEGFAVTYPWHDPESKAQMENIIGQRPRANRTEDYIVFPIPVGVPLGMDAYKATIFKAKDHLEAST